MKEKRRQIRSHNYRRLTGPGRDLLVVGVVYTQPPLVEGSLGFLNGRWSNVRAGASLLAPVMDCISRMDQ
jgi:hypothetical protein